MECSICKKPAVYHITRLVDDSPVDIHLCREHYQQYGSIGAELPMLGDQEAGQTLSQAGELSVEAPPDLACKSCGQTFRAFRESSKFGCSECYTYYQEQLEALLPRFQRDTRHTGKVPRGGAGRARLREEILELRMRKDEAVEREDFEAAARLRDQIRKLQGTDEE